MSNVLQNCRFRGREKSGLKLRFVDMPQQGENAVASLRDSAPAEYHRKESEYYNQHILGTRLLSFLLSMSA
jgi:hypothetical protein